MQTKQLYIPETIKVGFQKRSDTYTKCLGYVIYYDQKGVLRKEASWKSWCDKAISSAECKNEPTEGFVLNKGVGGGRSGWNHRNTYIRVYDPRGFEFEISVANLLFILSNCDCSRGKGLEGSFLYSWDGTELVLLPTNTQEYKESMGYTDLQSKGVKGKELVAGTTYTTKKQEKLIYLGRFNYHFMVTTNADPMLQGRYDTPKKDRGGVCRRYVFWDIERNDFLFLDSLSRIAAQVSDVVVSNYAELVDKYSKSPHGGAVKRLFVGPRRRKDKLDEYQKNCWAFEKVGEPGKFVQCSNSHQFGANKGTYEYVVHHGTVTVEDGVLCQVVYHRIARPNGQKFRTYSFNEQPASWVEPTDNILFAEMVSGEIIPVLYNNFQKGR